MVQTNTDVDTLWLPVKELWVQSVSLTCWSVIDSPQWVKCLYRKNLEDFRLNIREDTKLSSLLGLSQSPPGAQPKRTALGSALLSLTGFLSNLPKSSRPSVNCRKLVGALSTSLNLPKVSCQQVSQVRENSRPFHLKAFTWNNIACCLLFLLEVSYLHPFWAAQLACSGHAQSLLIYLFITELSVNLGLWLAGQSSLTA